MMGRKSIACRSLFASLFLADFNNHWWSAAAQDFTPPTSWRSPNVTLSVDDRIALASAAVDRAVAEISADNGQLKGSVSYDQTALLYASMAQFDGLTNQTLYKDRLKGWFPLAETLRPGFLDQLPYGYAAAQAYAVYQDSDFLDHAITAWSSAQLFTLSKDEINAGKSNVKPGFDLSKTCSGITMAGGTFWTTTADDPQLFGPSVGYFFVLSALLAKVTSNSTYLDAATLSGNFIKGHLLNRDNRLQDSISVKSTDSCSTGYFGDGSNLDNAGLFVEGLALLTSLTKDASDIQTMKDVLYATTTNTDWLNKGGILSVGDGKTGNILLPRALGTLYRANTTYSDLRNYIKLFLGNQYNAIREQATSGGSNVYGPSWVGPANNTFVAANQITAIAPLVDVISLQDQDPPSDSGSDGQHDDSDSSSSKSAPIGAIVGGVVGGLAVIGLVVLFFFLRRKKQKKQRLSLVIGDKPNTNAGNMRERPNGTSATSPFEGNEDYVVTPFLPHSEREEGTSSDYMDSSAGYPASTSTDSRARQQRPYRDSTTTRPDSSAIYPSDPNTSSTGSGFLAAQNRAGPSDQRSRLQLHGTRRDGPSSSSSGAGSAPISEKRRAAANALAAQQQSQQQHEQRRRGLPSLPGSNSGTGGGNESDNNAASGSAASAALSSDIASSNIPTEELVRMLNQRLQPEVWNEDEVPPDYDDALQGDERERRGA